MKKIILFSLLLIHCIHSLAQLSSTKLIDLYNFSALTIEDGLLHNFIDDIYKDKRGFLWLSTSNGLSRYDGYEFVHYNTSTEHTRLKSNFIKKVCEDNHNRLWIASESGLNILNLVTNKLITLEPQNEIMIKLTHEATSHIYKDSKGNMWLITSNNLYRISFSNQGDIHNISVLFSNGSSSKPITTIKEIENDIWIGFNNDIAKVRQNNNKLELIPALTKKIFDHNSRIHCLLQKDNEVWIGTNRGLYRYDLQNHNHIRYRYDENNPTSLSQSFITDLALTKEKELIVSTYKGLNFYSPITDSFIRIVQSKDNQDDIINCNFINCLLIDENIIWIGTEIGGLNKMVRRNLILDNYTHNKNNPYSISDNPVNSIFEDNSGNLWIGTVEGGLNLKLKGSDKFIHYQHKSDDKSSLGHNSVSVITQDNKNRLWVATWGRGVNIAYLNNPNFPNLKFTNYNTENTATLKNDFVGGMALDTLNNVMWISTKHGLHTYNLSKECFKYIPLCEDKLIDKDITQIFIDSKQRLWAGTSNGLLIIDLKSFQKNSSDIKHQFYQYKLDKTNSNLTEKINCIYEDRLGNIWLGSNGSGLYYLANNNHTPYTFIPFTVNEGLSSNNIYGILEDDNQNLWLSTNFGLSCFNMEKKTFTNYFKSDGILSDQFYWSAFQKTIDGTLYFGNTRGLLGIKGIRSSIYSSKKQVVLTKLTVLNNIISQGENDYLSNDISHAYELMLHEKDKSFSIEFSALDFENGTKNKFIYRLKGFDDSWIETDAKRRFANYTNLSPGNYVFQVKMVSTEDTTDEQITELLITIIPYFYKTVWFKSLLIASLVLIIILYYIWRIKTLIKREKELKLKVEERTHELQNKAIELSSQNLLLTNQYERIAQQKEQLEKMSQKIQEATADKIAFFTNITHEFRTPITLIIGPIEHALKLSHNPEVLEQLHIADRNTKSLLSLVNQLLDFRKVESGNAQIIKKKGHFVAFLKNILIPFEAFAKERNITVRGLYRMVCEEFYFDEECMRKVIVNLLSNAIKFTPDDGFVTLYAATYTNIKQETLLYLCINDTGIGIPKEEKEKIFDRFFQSHHQIKYPVYGQSGTGIGLYLCKYIIEQHGGKIYVKNNHKKGSSFRVNIPIEFNNNYTTDLQSDSIVLQNTLVPQLDREKRITILITDDNIDMRIYIRSILNEQYNILEAGNGAEALDILVNKTVDLIITDLMMPVMDGIELSKRIKEDITISHIPILIITAKVSSEKQIESYRIGVDDYLLKPFSEELLLVRIENILAHRKSNQRKFEFNMDLSILNMEEESRDKKFMDKVMQIVETNYKDPDFDVAKFCKAIGMSRTLLNRKIQELSGLSTAKFIQNYRLKLSWEILSKNKTTKNMNITDIAYEVGFNDPKYFTRCFHKHFGILPSAIITEKEQ